MVKTLLASGGNHKFSSTGLPQHQLKGRLMKGLVILCAVLLTACSTQPKVDESTYGASIGIVNHTAKFIYSASVNGGGGGHMAAWGAGVANVCCAMVPKKWHPGMQVVVGWDMPDGSKHIYKEKVVEVDKYDETGSVYIHFFPDDKIRVVISNYGGWSPKHPIPAPTRPPVDSIKVQ